MTRRLSRSTPALGTPTRSPAFDDDLLDDLPAAGGKFLFRVRRAVLRLGLLKSTLLATLFAAGSSLALVSLSNVIFPPPPGSVLITLVMAVVVPMVVAPQVAWVLVQLIFEAEAARRVAMRLAVTDPLTRAYNRRHFFRMGEHVLEGEPADRRSLSVLLLDVDHFKNVNDQHGHATGDEVLKAVASTCMECMRDHELFARFGGEEFVVLLPGTSLVDAAGIAERLRHAVQDLAIPGAEGTSVRPTVSIGVASSSGAATTLDKLLAQADQAMYLAKRSGRNRVVTETAAA